MMIQQNLHPFAKVCVNYVSDVKNAVQLEINYGYNKRALK